MEKPGSLFIITVLAVDENNHIVRADDKKIKGLRPNIKTTLTKSITTVGQGRQKLVDEHHCRLWTSSEGFISGRSFSDDTQTRFYMLGDTALKVRTLLDTVYGMKTDGVVMIEHLLFNGGTIHIG